MTSEEATSCQIGDVATGRQLPGCGNLPAALDPMDVIGLVLQVRQVDREQQPEHWLWSDRIMACTVARLMRVPEIATIVLNAERYLPGGSAPGSLARGPEG